MSYRKMTPEEVHEWLGAGLVMPVPRPAPAPAQPPDSDQSAHDRWMASRTPAQRTAMVRGLGALARSKLGDKT